MRNRGYGGAARVAFAAIWATVALASPVAAAPQPTQYLALGDSLAWGDGASDPSQTAYVPRLAEYFAGVPHGGAKTSVNLGVRGETTQSFLDDQLASALAVIGDPNADMRVVTVSIGGNDVGSLLNDPSDVCLQDPTSLTCQALVGQALQGVASRLPTVLGSIMAALQADEGDERVYVMTVYNPFGGLGGPYEGAVDVALLGSDLRIDCQAIGNDPAAAGLNDIIACVAIAVGATVVDAYPVIGDEALALTHIGEGTLDTHPNDEGYALLAKAHRLASE